MPALANDRHEKAAQYRAKGLTQLESYELAGYSPNKGNAANLFAQPEVKARVEEIKAERQKLEDRRRLAYEELQATQDGLGIDDSESETHGITREWIILQYKQVIQKAQEEGKHAAAASALREVTKLLGLDKPPPGDPNKPPPLQPGAPRPPSGKAALDMLADQEAEAEVAQEEEAEDGADSQPA